MPRNYHNPRVSPDGRKLSLDFTDLVRDIWVYDFRDTTLSRLTFENDGHDGFWAPDGRRLFYASATGDRLTHPGPTDELLLGGDSGLRGYPMRYQSGHRRALFTFEERAYSNIYLWQLFRLGGAVFVDVGRAWGGDATNQIQPGWLSNAGIGLRIFSGRAAFSNVLHLDIAVPNDPVVGVKKLQFNIKTKASFGSRCPASPGARRASWPPSPRPCRPAGAG